MDAAIGGVIAAVIIVFSIAIPTRVLTRLTRAGRREQIGRQDRGAGETDPRRYGLWP